MPFINTKTTVSLSKSKKDSLTAEICRITRECLGKGENWVMTGFEDNASLFFQGILPLSLMWRSKASARRPLQAPAR